MKVIFITREGNKLPGARIRCYNFAKELSRYGLDAEVLSFSDTLGAKDGENESQMKWREKIKYNWEAFKRLAIDKGIVLYIQRFNYHSFAPYLAHLVYKNRIIFDLDDWEMRENPKYYMGFYPSSKAYYFTRQIARRSIFCIAASRFLEKFLLQFNKKVYLISSGVDTEKFKPSAINFGTNEIVFSWVGTLHKMEYVENINFALNCFATLRKEYPNIYFDIVGDGIYRSILTQIVKRFNDLNIRYKGWILPDEIPAYLNTVIIGLLPVVKDTKFNRAKSPTKLFEYMAMAKPTISSLVGEPVHIIKDGKNGFLAKTKEEFIKKMQNLIEDSNLRKCMGERARETVKQDYSLKVLGKRLYEIINQI